jgi:hypothetical protein
LRDLVLEPLPGLLMFPSGLDRVLELPRGSELLERLGLVAHDAGGLRTE